MSGLAAILNLNSAPASRGDLAAMLTSLQQCGPDGTSAIALGPVVLGCARFDTLPEDRAQPVTCARVTVVADARLDNRSDLENDLSVAKSASEAELIAAALARWGEGAPEHLEGDFAVIAWLAHQQKLLAFRDRFGVRPLFMAETGSRLLIASSVDSLLAHPSVNSDFDPDYFISYFATRRVITALTPYRAIKRVERATALACRPGTPARQFSYYRLQARHISATADEAAAMVRHLLEEAVKARLRGKNLSCEVSGGMDSTSVFALARRHRPDIEARSMVSDRLPQVDERRYSRSLIGTSAWRQIRVEDLLSLEKFNCARLFNEPVQELLLGAVRQALYEPFGQVQLSGHGGDALMIAKYGLLGRRLRSGNIVRALHDARKYADRGDRPLLEVLSIAARTSKLPLARFDWATPNARAFAKAVTSDLRRRYAYMGAEFQLFELYNETALVPPVIPVDHRYPYLDRLLVEYCLALSPELKSQGSKDKLILRTAMADILPAEILERQAKTSFASLHALATYQNLAVVDRWLSQPILSDLKVLTVDQIRAFATSLREGKQKNLTEAMIVISAEAWLQGRTANRPAHRQHQLARGSVPLQVGGKEVEK
jgi:asparagine synthase (glutamine-hydrolysing)